MDDFDDLDPTQTVFVFRDESTKQVVYVGNVFGDATFVVGAGPGVKFKILMSIGDKGFVEYIEPPPKKKRTRKKK